MTPKILQRPTLVLNRNWQPVTFSRRNIFKRDHYTCQYCGAQPGSDELTLDHVVPHSLPWCVELGELRAGLHGLQQAEGRPHAGAGADAPAPQTGPADLEAAGHRCAALVGGPRTTDRGWSKFISEAYWSVTLRE